MPELEKLQSQMSGMGMGGGSSSKKASGGFVDSLKGALGLGNGSGGRNDRLESAERLTQEYADELQSHLETKKKWESIRSSYADR